MRQRTHYLPRHYLKGFCVGKNCFLWQHDLKEHKAVNLTDDNAAVITDLYPQSVEADLANKIEDPANKSIDRLRKRQLLTYSQKQTFTRYLLTMMRRVPHAKDETNEMARPAAVAVIDDVEKVIHMRFARGTTSQSRYEEELQQLAAIRTSYEKGLPDYIWHDSIDGGRLTGLMAVLPQMSWCYLLAPPEEPFITSDNPVWYPRSLGIGYPESELAFPISSDLCLLLKWNEPCGDRFLNLHTRLVKEINGRIVRSAQRYVFSIRKESWVDRAHKNKRIARGIPLWCTN